MVLLLDALGAQGAGALLVQWHTSTAAPPKATSPPAMSPTSSAGVIGTPSAVVLEV